MAERCPVSLGALLRPHRRVLGLFVALELTLVAGAIQCVRQLLPAVDTAPVWLAAGLGALAAAALAGLLLLALGLRVLAREEELRFCAYHDRLTGLPNRRLFRDLFDRELRLAEREQRQLGLLFIDLDGFKAVNDGLGHEEGDELLRQAARRMQNCLRQADTVSRLGGDEFTVLLTGLSRADDASGVAEQILRALAAPFDLCGNHRSIGASIGIALCPRDGSDDANLLRRADQAMYRAKALGGNRYVFYGEEAVEPVRERPCLTAAGRRAALP